MRTRIYRLLATAALLFLSISAQAAVSCSISSPGFFSVYDGLAATANLNQTTYTINCTRLATDSAIFNYITFTDDGQYNTGANNKAKLTTANTFIKYDFFTDAGYVTNWSKSTKCIVGSLNFGTALSASQTRTVYSRIIAGQTGLTQGSYLDDVAVNISYNQTACQNGAPIDNFAVLKVNISNVPACQIAVAPGTVAFSYTAFSSTQAAANTTFQARCSTTLLFGVSIDSTQSGGFYPGVVSGLNYSLSLGLTAGGPPILPATSQSGNGALQTYFINGTMAAGQAGTCASSTCSASDPRTLTITY